MGLEHQFLAILHIPDIRIIFPYYYYSNLFHTIPLFEVLRWPSHGLEQLEVLSSTAFVSLQQGRPDKLKARREHRFLGHLWHVDLSENGRDQDNQAVQ